MGIADALKDKTNEQKLNALRSKMTNLKVDDRKLPGRAPGLMKPLEDAFANRTFVVVVLLIVLAIVYIFTSNSSAAAEKQAVEIASEAKQLHEQDQLEKQALMDNQKQLTDQLQQKLSQMEEQQLKKQEQAQKQAQEQVLEQQAQQLAQQLAEEKEKMRNQARQERMEEERSAAHDVKVAPKEFNGIEGPGKCEGATFPFLPFEGSSAIKVQQNRRLLDNKRRHYQHRHLLNELDQVDSSTGADKRLQASCRKIKRERMNAADGSKVTASEVQGMIALRECLLATDSVSGFCNTKSLKEEDYKTIARSLQGVNMLLTPPDCILVTSEGTCASLGSDRPTHFQIEPAVDINTNWPTCALVGPLKSRLRENDVEAIQSSTSIWRFDLEIPKNPTGHTTVRLFGKHWFKAMLTQDASTMTTDEKKTFRDWNQQYYEVKDGRATKKTAHQSKQEWIVGIGGLDSEAYIPKVKQSYDQRRRIIDPGYAQWIIDAHYHIMADLEELGLGPFSCNQPDLQASVQGLLIAVRSCRRISMYGFDYQKSVFPAYLYRLLHIAEVLSIC